MITIRKRDMDITYSDKISLSDYNKLRKSTKWIEIEKKQAHTGLKNSAFMIVAKDRNKTVGMARVITDGGYFALIVDVIVLPKYQKNGIGQYMMQAVMDYLYSCIGEGQSMYINLMAEKNKEGFYEKFGFNKRPDKLNGAGMTQYIEKPVNK